VLGHLLAVVPGQRATQPPREPTHGRGQRWADLLGPPTGRQGDQQDRSAGPLDQGQHRRGTFAEHQVAFPMAWDLAPVCLGGPQVNRDGVEQLASSLGQALAARVAHRPAGAQTAPQVTVEDPTVRYIQAEVDGLVGDPHAWVVGIGHLEPACDLLRRPAQPELGLHDCAESRVYGQLARLGSGRSPVRGRVGDLGSIPPPAAVAGDFP